MIHNKRLFIQCSIGLLAIIINVLFPELVASYQYYVLAIAILLTGMPHGAIDHIIAFQLQGWDDTIKNQLLFYSSYLGLMLIYSLLWIYFPLFSFISFMLITLYHFGQADAMRFDLDTPWQWFVHISRGITVVGLIMYGDISYTSPVIESLTGFSFAVFTQGLINISSLKIILAVCYPLSFAITSIFQRHNIGDMLTASLDALIVSALFYFCDTIWAFSIYFGIWHAYNHIRVMLRFVNLKGSSADWMWFYRKSFWFSLIPYLGIAALYFLLDAFNSEQLLVFILFIAISVMTLPHMLIVEKMYGLFGDRISRP